MGMASRLSSMTRRMPERSDSLRRSLISVIFLVLTRSTMLSMSEARFTWYGSSVTMIALRLPFSDSVCALARTRMRPRPVR